MAPQLAPYLPRYGAPAGAISSKIWRPSWRHILQDMAPQLAPYLSAWPPPHAHARDPHIIVTRARIIFNANSKRKRQQNDEHGNHAHFLQSSLLSQRTPIAPFDRLLLPQENGEFKDFFDANSHDV